MQTACGEKIMKDWFVFKVFLFLKNPVLLEKAKCDFKENIRFYKNDKSSIDSRYNKISGRLSLKLFLFTALLLNPIANASIKCFNIFKTKKVIYSLNKDSPLTSSYSKLILKKVYQQLPLLEGIELTYKETQNYTLQLEQLIQLLEKNSNQTEKRLELLDSYLTPALKKLPKIISFVKSESALKHESLDTQTILRLTLSTLSLHLYTYLTQPKIKNLDWPRLRTILESVSNFDSKQPAFSLYKIYRSVREKYSIEEYINCK